MDFNCLMRLLVVTLMLLCVHSKADVAGSVYFLDSKTHQYFRPRLSEVVAETDSMTLPEVGAAVSVLLGLAPSSSLSSHGSSKLNKVVMPNPFDRPRAVFTLEVIGAADSQVTIESAHGSQIDFDSYKADIQLPGEGEVYVVSLNEPSSSDDNSELTDKMINDFATWLGGSYAPNPSTTMSGELIIPLASGSDINLHMSKKADKQFAASLLHLINNIQRATDMHQDLIGTIDYQAAELLTGTFKGVKVLQKEYGKQGVAEQGLELLLASVSKIYTSMQTAYGGKLVGVILLGETTLSESETMLNLMYTSEPSARLLQEVKGSSNSTIAAAAEVIFVRTLLAWLTGIILIIATLLGTYYLMYMPITRDTLLYSNVKLD
ncbi:uncharacterized protein LOC124939774 [Impatiens glandulifera]|uniref:uncharacterized protein LOC124939774 n=1 Tax=Impatiens glandulifera TaxID=253017 RepID=UPI001FB0CD6D|nr:uncharacterized protein LOC124939774 [Impatiens glandulifera]